MKGQMFIVIIIFLAGFVIVVQQLLVQYSAVDVTDPILTDDSLILVSVLGGLEDTSITSTNCAEARINLKDVTSYYKAQSILGGFIVDIDYDYDCGNWYNYEPDPHALSFSLKITGDDTETTFDGGFYSNDPECEELSEAWIVTQNLPDARFQYSPPGQCEFFDVSDSDITKLENDSVNDFPNNYTFTISMKTDQATASIGADTYQGFSIHNGITECEVLFAQDGIYVTDNSPVLVPNTNQYIDNNWHEWSVQFESFDPANVNQQFATLFRDGEAIPEVSKINCQDPSGGDGVLEFVNAGTSTDTAEMHIATFNLQTGIVQPINVVSPPGLTCTDGDGDSYNLEGGSCGPIDCNDGNKAIFPTSLEICDGLINDCDNQAAIDGSGVPTPLNTLQLGVCAGSFQTCAGVQGWQDDYKDVQRYNPGSEVCNDDFDNDCDGLVNEECSSGGCGDDDVNCVQINPPCQGFNCPEGPTQPPTFPGQGGPGFP